MVALNTDFAPSKTNTDTKNRVGGFFSLAAEPVGVDSRSSRNRIGEKRVYGYETASVDTEFEYGPFGELIRSTGSKKDDFSFRFSTKYEDAETGLLYYGFRYYDAVTGRWLSRDPIGERGGINLYGMVANNPVNYADALGLLKIRNPNTGGIITIPDGYVPVRFTGQGMRYSEQPSGIMVQHLASGKRSIASLETGRTVVSQHTGIVDYGWVEVAEPGLSFAGATDFALEAFGGTWYLYPKSGYLYFVDGNQTAATAAFRAGTEDIILSILGAKLLDGCFRSLDEAIQYLRRKGADHKLEQWVRNHWDELQDFGKGRPRGNNYDFNPDVDLDWRGSGKGYKDALDEAFERTGIPRDDFEVTRWGRDPNGKSIPVQWDAPGGAQVNVDIPSWNNVNPDGSLGNGPYLPHVGYQTPGKGSARTRGHIFTDGVPGTR